MDAEFQELLTACVEAQHKSTYEFKIAIAGVLREAYALGVSDTKRKIIIDWQHFAMELSVVHHQTPRELFEEYCRISQLDGVTVRREYRDPD